jgi:hypothetical protein
MLDEAENDVLAFMDFPKAHRKQLASTNPLERINAGVKRRTDVVGIFPNDAAIVRLVGALLFEQNDEWQLQRHYMQLEGLNAVSDNQATRLSIHTPGAGLEWVHFVNPHPSGASFRWFSGPEILQDELRTPPRWGGVLNSYSRCWTRTSDPLINSQLLYQLS